MKKKRYTRGRLRTELIAFYVTKEEKEIITGKAFDTDQTLSDFCRKTLIYSNQVQKGKVENV